MIATLHDGREVTITDRHYLTRPSGETVLTGVTTADGRRIAAREVAGIHYAA